MAPLRRATSAPFTTPARHHYSSGEALGSSSVYTLVSRSRHLEIADLNPADQPESGPDHVQVFLTCMITRCNVNERDSSRI